MSEIIINLKVILAGATPKKVVGDLFFSWLPNFTDHIDEAFFPSPKVQICSCIASLTRIPRAQGANMVIQGVNPLPLTDRRDQHTLPFLQALLRCDRETAPLTPLTYQIIDDYESRKDPDLAYPLRGSIDLLMGELDRLNQLGAGILLRINPTDGRGDTAGHVTGYRGVWVDLDLKDAAAEVDIDRLVAALPCRPTIVIRTGHGWHIYWIFRVFPATVRDQVS